ncbi:amino acid-binding protein [Acrocarpospora pleiomorpha]|uniref:Amino acid-binding protein n=1 Tax=Acrocarpospora pleiomorpha TaxID=90975 RepID=A0A5M3XCC8_9ACTN|nr:ABC transporter substrate-binding protein [Acrocarpospora pleiomorpha]GES19325.1 amino acid-binding protein [Acrocarpospora pleiomorpha]
MRRARIPVALASALIMLSACASNGGDSGSDDGVLRIGLINPVTGAASFAGIPVQRGTQIAVDEINSSGYLGNGRRLELTSDDSAGDPAKAIAQFRGYDSAGYLAVVCCTVSTEAGSLGPLIKKAGLPTVVNGATLPGLSAPPYLYRTIALPSSPGGMYDQLIDAAAAQYAPKTAVLAVTADNGGQVDDGKIWAAALERNGVDILQTIDTFTSDTDFSATATKVINAKPDVLVESMLGSKSALLTKALRDRGFQGRILSSYGVATAPIFKAGGSAMAGTIFPIPFTPLADNDATRKFVNLFKQAYGVEPDLFAAQGYNAVRFIAEGIKKTGTTDRATLAKALSEIQSFQSVSGSTYTMQNGQAVLSDKVGFLQWNADGTQRLWP